MSNNPAATLVRHSQPLWLHNLARAARPVGLQLCLATHPRGKNKPELAHLVCTRINDHEAHCCDEIEGASWYISGDPANCKLGHDHREEKGLKTLPDGARS